MSHMIYISHSCSLAIFQSTSFWFTFNSRGLPVLISREKACQMGSLGLSYGDSFKYAKYAFKLVPDGNQLFCMFEYLFPAPNVCNCMQCLPLDSSSSTQKGKQSKLLLPFKRPTPKLSPALCG